MKVLLLTDYRGVLTNEQFYTAGSYAVPADMPKAHAAALVAAGRANVQKARRVSRKKTTVTKRPTRKQ